MSSKEKELWQEAMASNGEFVWTEDGSDPHFSYAAAITNVASAPQIVSDLDIQIGAQERASFAHFFIVRSFLDQPTVVNISGEDKTGNLSFSCPPTEAKSKFIAKAETGFAASGGSAGFEDGSGSYFGCFVQIERDTIFQAQNTNIDGTFRLRLIEGAHGDRFRTLEEGKYDISVSVKAA